MIITKNSDLNNLSFGKYQAPIKQYCESAELLAVEKSRLPALFPIVDSSEWAEGYGGQTSQNKRFKPGGENTATTEVDVQDRHNKTVENDVEWKAEMSISKQMIEDGKLGVVKDKAGAFIDNYYDTREVYCADFMTNFNATSHDFEGTTFDITGGDAVALASTAHPSVSGGYANQSNYYDGVFSDDNLSYLEAALADQRDDNGRKLRLQPDTLIMPFGQNYAADSAQRKLVYGALNATGNPTSADRAGTYNSKRFNVEEWNFLGAPTGLTAGTSWFIIADMKYIKRFKPYVLQERTDLEIHSYMDYNTWANIWSGRSRMKASPTMDWRGFIVVVPGGGGTSLPT